MHFVHFDINLVSSSNVASAFWAKLEKLQEGRENREKTFALVLTLNVNIVFFHHSNIRQSER